MRTDMPPIQYYPKQVSGLALIPLIFLPCLFLIFSVKYFDGSGMGDSIYFTIGTYVYFGLTVLCSLGTALGIVRLLSLAGVTKIVAMIILAVILFSVSLVGTSFVAAMLFLPNC